METRAYDGPDDLWAMQQLAQRLWRDDPRVVEHNFGELGWWASRCNHGDWTARLWLDGGELVAWGWLTRPAELEWQVDPAHAELLEDVLDWFESQADGPAETAVLATSRDAIERLTRRGYEHDADAPWFRVNARTLTAIDEPRVPAGYSLRTVRGEEDLAPRVASHRAAWESSRVTEESYRFVMRTRAYRADLDCVLEAPDGTLVANALAWLDEENGLGELEPVGTHRDHRRRGFARAVNTFALHRLRALGAETALVASRGDAAYPVPTLLYESIGFRELMRSVPYVRASGS